VLSLDDHSNWIPEKIKSFLLQKSVTRNNYMNAIGPCNFTATTSLAALSAISSTRWFEESVESPLVDGTVLTFFS
jgi:hypothetical protein